MIIDAFIFAVKSTVLLAVIFAGVVLTVGAIVGVFWLLIHWIDIAIKAVRNHVKGAPTHD